MDSGNCTEIKAILKETDGILDVISILPRDIEKIIAIESDFQDTDMPQINLGLLEMKNRAEHLVIVKNLDFPQPLEPTFYLVRECSGKTDKGRFFQISGKNYQAVGEEITEGWTDTSEGLITGDSIILYPESRKNRKAMTSFLFPPLSFPALDSRSGELGIGDIISATPSTKVCGYLNETYNISSGGEIALLVLGFNRHKTL